MKIFPSEVRPINPSSIHNFQCVQKFILASSELAAYFRRTLLFLLISFGF
jgi:hypothetical protein